MKTRVNELCKQRGLTLKELSSRIGVKQSNLTQSLKGNPTIGYLKSIADVLEVTVSELIEKQESNISGYLEVDGKVQKIISKKDLLPIVGTFGIPTYVSYKVCKKDLYEFLRKDIRDVKYDNFSAIIDGALLINVFKAQEIYEDEAYTHDYVFNVTIHTVDGRRYNYSFPGISFADEHGAIDYKDLLRFMWCEIIGCIDPNKDYSGSPEEERLALD